MKKISLITLAALMAVSAKAQANMEDPMLVPRYGMTYLKTDVFYDYDDDTSDAKLMDVSMELGYGITPKLGLLVHTGYTIETGDEEANSKDISVGLIYRPVNDVVMIDLVAEYGFDTSSESTRNFLGAQPPTAVGEDDAFALYAVRLGKKFANATLGLTYMTQEYGDASLDTSLSGYRFEGQYRFNPKWSVNVRQTTIVLDITGMGEFDSDKTRLQLNYAPKRTATWGYFVEKNNEETDEEMSMGIKYDFVF